MFNFRLSPKRLFDGLHPKGQTISISLPWIGFHYSFTNQSEQVSKSVLSGFTRAKTAQAMLRLNGLETIFAQHDAHAALLKPKLQPYLHGESMLNVATRLSQGFLHDVRQALGASESASLDVLPLLQSRLEIALLEEVLGIDCNQSMRDALARLAPSPIGIESVSKVFAWSLLPLPLWVKRLFLPKVRRMAMHHKQEASVVRQHAHIQQGTWYAQLCELQKIGRITEAHVRGEINLAFDSAYVMTTSLLWSMLCLAQNPHHQRHIAGSSRGALHAKYCFLESLRLYPPFYMLSYATPTPASNSKCPFARFSRLMNFKRVANVVVSVLGLHRNSSVWDEPNSFYPERFDPHFNQSLKAIQKHAYIPFGVGHRACPARAFSITIAERFLTALCGDFGYELELVGAMPQYKRNALLMSQNTRMLFKVKSTA